MDIDGVNVEDGAVVSGGWQNPHVPAMMAMHGMPSSVGRLPGSGMSVLPHALEVPPPLDATEALSFPAPPSATPVPIVLPATVVAMYQQQQQQLMQQRHRQRQRQVQAQAKLPPQRPVPQPMPSATLTNEAPPVVIETPPSTPPAAVGTMVDAPSIAVVDTVAVETPAEIKTELEPLVASASTTNAPVTRAKGGANGNANDIPTDVHEIIVRAKEFRLKTGKQPTKKLTESRVTGERPLDVALAEARIITQNVYVQRKPRKWEEDEVPVCACKRPEDEDQLGCLEDCVNRAALIECLADFCPCGDQCDNQRIQRGLMPVSEVIYAGKKGLGIMTRQFIKHGDFVAEYMGEIVTEQEYHLRRLRYHNEKHRYMMVLSGGEVIDATRMGGLARFINHSCEPNCGVEKWEVNGEERCAIFALRDIHPGEELSFDYKFQSFSALEITTCLCGATNCRGYIGVNNRAGKLPRKSCASHTAPSLTDRTKQFDPITKKGRSGRKTLEAALERMYRALAGHRMFTKKEITMLLDARLLLKRNLSRQLDSNLRLLCLEPYFVSDDDGEFHDMEPVFNVRDLPGFPAKPAAMPRIERQQRLEVVVERLRTSQR